MLLRDFISSARSDLSSLEGTAPLYSPEEAAALVSRLCEALLGVTPYAHIINPNLEIPEASLPALQDALARYPAAERTVFPMLCEVERESPVLSGYLRPDHLVSGNREFALRRVWRGVVKEDTDGPVQN